MSGPGRSFGAAWAAVARWNVDVGRRFARLPGAVVFAVRDRILNLYAMGLVYITLLSLVPCLAVMFSLLKAFGAQYRIEPWLLQWLAPLGPQARTITDRLVSFVDRVQVGALGAIGFVGLFYTAISLVGKLEEALNYVWHVRRERPLARKFTDYLAILLIGPVLIFVAFAILASAQSRWVLERVLAVTRLQQLTILVTAHVTPFVFLCIAFTLLYRFVPYTRVRLAAAAVGGISGAVLWHLAGWGFAAFIAGSTSYRAIYSGFAGLVVFLIWLDAAWLVVLVGAQIAYAWDHAESAAPARLHGTASLERVALAVLLEIAVGAVARRPPSRVEDLAVALGVRASVVDETVGLLVDHGVLVRAAEPPGIVLARPPAQVALVEVLDAVRDPASLRRPAGTIAAVEQVLAQRDRAARDALRGVSLQDLLGAAGEASAGTTLARLSDYRR